MTNLEIIEKYRSFLISLKSNIENDVKFSITRLINDNQMSDSTREALYLSNILEKSGVGKATKYTWLAGDVTNELVELFKSKIKNVNKNYSISRSKKRSVETKNQLLALMSKYYSSFTFKNLGNQYVFEFIGTELTTDFCTDLRKFEDYSIKFHLSYTNVIFNK